MSNIFLTESNSQSVWIDQRTSVAVSIERVDTNEDDIMNLLKGLLGF